MTGTLLLYDPTAPARASATARQPALASLTGKVVGFIDNAKPNFRELADDLAAALVADHGVARVVRHRKRAASVPAATEALDALAVQCDLVIAGAGD